MSKRNRRRKASRRSTRVSAAPAPAGPAPGAPAPRPSARWLLLGGGLAVGLVLWVWLGRGGRDDDARKAPEDTPDASTAPQAKGRPAEKKSGAGSAKDPGGSFLEAFGGKEGAGGDSSGSVLGNADLERKFHTLVEARERVEELKRRAGRGQASPEDLREGPRLLTQLNRDLDAFQKELAQARKARPKDAVPEWLTGELLVQVGGEPDEILPHLQLALQRGLSRPRFFATLARAQAEANQPDEAFRSAGKALELAGRDRYVWDTFTRTAFDTERFAEVTARLEHNFPGKRPDWVETMRAAAADWQARWQAEQKLRAAEAKADDLPRVRLTIAHRRFARDARGTPLTKVETTGHGEVILELFEDQAPAAVANFLDLVEHKQYDGTRFYMAEPAKAVAGGDPRSRKTDPSEDRMGGGDFVIPDELGRPGARGHFRGALGMVNQGPHTAGAQFYLTLAPIHEMDGHFTVFGRVIKGQEVLDRVTMGRTNREVGHFGRTVPGDLLLRAEVLRKRPHEYKVIREPAK
jgi:cyclophilin family peptidyl-prolyl cis-trans isomerase